MANYISPEGLEKLKKELAEREGTTRPDIARKIAEAKQLGDLSENAEYAEAREAQGMNEMRIEELKDILKNAVLLDTRQKSHIVIIGSTIMLESKAGKREYTIVGPAESDPANGFISNETPLGRALMGHKKGDEVEISVPSGKMKYKILDIK